MPTNVSNIPSLLLLFNEASLDFDLSSLDYGVYLIMGIGKYAKMHHTDLPSFMQLFC
jgi:hypothetical protein